MGTPVRKVPVRALHIAGAGPERSPAVPVQSRGGFSLPTERNANVPWIWAAWQLVGSVFWQLRPW